MSQYDNLSKGRCNTFHRATDVATLATRKLNLNYSLNPLFWNM